MVPEWRGGHSAMVAEWGGPGDLSSLEALGLEGYMQDLGIINFLDYLCSMCVSAHESVWALSFFLLIF